VSDFNLAIDVLLSHEGGLSNNPKDPGGLTNFGITLPFLRELDPKATPDDLLKLTRIGAEVVYQKLLWNKWDLDMINDQSIATKLLDSCVWQGWPWAFKTAQSCCCRGGHPVTTDGVLGPKTRWAINACRPSVFLADFCEAQLDLIDSECGKHPALETFRPGWTLRAKWMGDYA